MEFHIMHFYPDLMNLYGSYANVSVLRRLLKRAGHTVTVEQVNPDGHASLTGVDFVCMGAGMERRQKVALEDFVRYAGEIKAAASDGVTMFFAGSALELLGTTVTDSAGRVWNGVGLAEFSTLQHTRRMTGDVYGHTVLYPDAVVGFMNKSGVVTGVDTPLLARLDMGFGNECERGPEGYCKNNVFGSELTGPLLVKNPRLLETVAGRILTRRGITPPDPWPLDEWAVKGYAVTARELQLRVQSTK